MRIICYVYTDAATYGGTPEAVTKFAYVADTGQHLKDLDTDEVIKYLQTKGIHPNV